MVTLYGSKICPDCRQCKRNFDMYKIPYTYCDITAKIQNLKAFLRLRDTEELFKPVREEEHRVGIPVLQFEDGSLTFDWQGYVRSLGFEADDKTEVPEDAEDMSADAKAPATEMPIGKACGLDGKGC
jgi:glutaredoxin-related protein